MARSQAGEVIRRFARNHLGVVDLIIVGLLVLVAAFAPVIAPKDPAEQDLRTRRAPHIATIPGVAIALAVLGFNLLGDGLRDALDTKMKS